MLRPRVRGCSLEGGDVSPVVQLSLRNVLGQIGILLATKQEVINASTLSEEVAVAKSDCGDKLEVEFEGMRECFLEYTRRVRVRDPSLALKKISMLLVGSGWGWRLTTCLSKTNLACMIGSTSNLAKCPKP